MVRFLTPLRLARLSDVQVREQLLQAAPKTLALGYEVILLEDDYLLAEELVVASRGLSFSVCSVHVPFPQVDGDPTQFDLRNAAGQTKLRATADIATRLGAKVVVVHSQLAYAAEDWNESYNTTPWRDGLFQEIVSSIQTVQRDYPAVTLCLENMPLPLFADSVAEGERMRYNPCWLTYEDMKRLQQLGQPLTWDICHYDLMRRLWPAAHSILGTYPDSPQPDYLTVITTMGQAIKHLHLADSAGLWHNSGRLPQGGLALGTGEQDREELASLLHYLAADASTEYTMNLEIRDRDLQHPNETAASLEFLVNLLYGSKT